MKVAELLTEASPPLILRMAQQLERELEELEKEQRLDTAIEDEIPYEHHPVLWNVYTMSHMVHGAKSHQVTINRAGLTMGPTWDACKVGIMRFLEDEGYIDGIMPISVEVETSNMVMLRLTLS